MTAKGLSCDVVDFSSILSDSTDLSTCPQVKEIHSAFSTVGFVFLKNHGIERKLVFKMPYPCSTACVVEQIQPQGSSYRGSYLQPYNLS